MNMWSNISLPIIGPVFGSELEIMLFVVVCTISV